MRNELELVSEWKRPNVGIAWIAMWLYGQVGSVDNFSAWILVQDK